MSAEIQTPPYAYSNEPRPRKLWDADDMRDHAADKLKLADLEILTLKIRVARTSDALRLCIAALEPLARDYPESAAAVAYRLANDALA